MDSNLDPTSVCRPGASREMLTGLVDGLVQEMHQSWRRHDRHQAEVYLRRTPELARHPDAAVRLICEEISLRREDGEQVSATEFLERFPEYKAQLRHILDLPPSHSTRTFPAGPSFPQGEIFGEFMLLEELGKGAEGRVFLAQQRNLAHRLVVLKFSSCGGAEHFALARLQHTNIVPLYSVQEDRRQNMRVLCMPYFGRATLKQIFENLGRIPIEMRQGHDIVSALDDVAGTATLIRQSESHNQATTARKLLGSLDYPRAICWLGTCLAEALQVAHDHGLIHLDLKPSNILLAADGQPMLLDFHLARPPLKTGEPAPEWLGGTLGYMPPEQRLATANTLARRPISQDVDERADIYALGVFLYEALSGKPAVSLEQPLPRLRTCNRQVSPGLADIIHHATEENAARRYRKAADLAGDLRRHLDNRPLCGVPNRSVVERWGKWRRRQPMTFPLLVLGLALAVALCSAGVLGWNYRTQRRDEAQNALLDGQNLIRRGHFAEAELVLQRGLERTGHWTDDLRLGQALDYHAQLARRAHKARELHDLADKLRTVHVLDGQALRWLFILDAGSRKTWDERASLEQTGVVKLEPAEEKRIRLDLLDLALIWSDLRVRLTPVEQKQVGHHQARIILQQAESIFGPQAVLIAEKKLHLGSDVPEPQVGLDGAPMTALPEHWLLSLAGRTALRQGRLKEAEAELRKSLELEPQDFWPNFYFGLCRQRQGDHTEAVVAFSFCVGHDPSNAEILVQRGRSFVALGSDARALADFQQALKVRPNLAEAHIERGLLALKQRRYDDALADLTAARKQDADPLNVHYHLALVHLARKEPEAARAHLERVLQLEPGHRQARELWHKEFDM